jgi:hypothetical protein
MGEQRAWQRRREGVESILTRIASDPAYRQSIRTSPNLAIRDVGGAADDGSPEVVGMCFMSCSRMMSCRGESRVTR